MRRRWIPACAGMTRLGGFIPRSHAPHWVDGRGRNVAIKDDVDGQRLRDCYCWTDKRHVQRRGTPAAPAPTRPRAIRDAKPSGIAAVAQRARKSRSNMPDETD